LAELTAIGQSFPDAPRTVQIAARYARKIFASRRIFSADPAKRLQMVRLQSGHQGKYFGGGFLKLSKRIYIDTHLS